MNDKRASADLAELEELFEIVREFDLDAMLVEDGPWRLELVRREPSTVAVASATGPAPAAEPVSHVAEAASSAQSAAAAPAQPAGEAVNAPIVGVFYRAPAPTSPAFVEIGDRVSVGQTLCILEAMKLMNEITSDVSGVVSAILVENGDLVTIGQPMFVIA